MIEAVESVGEVVTGGMAARAVEPHSGEAAAHADKCLNCGTALAGEYCHRCGQQGHVHRTLRAFWHDLVHGVLHFEGKVWRTVPMLAWHPGELTRRYVNGERSKFVSPVALFLFSVFAMLATYNLVGTPTLFADLPGLADSPKSPQTVRQELTDLDRGLKRLRVEYQQGERTQALRRERVLAIKEGRSVEAINTAIRQKLLVMDDAKRPAWAVTFVRKISENRSLLFYKMQNNAYKFSWALIPISVPFLWLLLFRRREYGVYDHIVFITYSITFITLVLVSFSLLHAVGVPAAALSVAAALIPPAHFYRQLRGAYALSRSGAAWRAALLSAFALLAAFLFFILLLAIGVAG
jgi:hypothetical protein